MQSIKIIRTVLRDIPPEPRYCQSHEHIWISPEMLGGSSPVLPIDSFQASENELKCYRSLGGEMLVDAQPVNAGGSPRVLAELSAAADVSVIASTGFHKLCFYRDDSPVFTKSTGELSEEFCKDIRDGRCGIIKMAADRDTFRGRYAVLHLAAASAALKTGAHLICHVEQGADPFDIIGFYGEHGVSPESLILCHCDRAVPDSAVLLSVLRHGVYLEFDTVARPKYHNDGYEIKLIQTVCDAGFSDRLLLGLDTTRQRLRSYGDPSAPGLDYIITRFIPQLIGSGIPAGTVDMFMKHNPAGALSFTPEQ